MMELGYLAQRDTTWTFASNRIQNHHHLKQHSLARNLIIQIHLFLMGVKFHYRFQSKIFATYIILLMLSQLEMSSSLKSYKKYTMALIPDIQVIHSVKQDLTSTEQQ